MKCSSCGIQYEAKDKIDIEWVFAFNKAHRLNPNGEPPGMVVTKKELWDAYNSKMGNYPKSPGLSFKEIE